MNRIDSLPEELQRAQRAIQLPEIQGMIQELSVHGLAVCMPHMHSEEGSGFAVLPDGVVQLERDLAVSFVPRSELEQLPTIPVAWRWGNGGESIGAACVTSACYVTTRQSGGEGHTKHHQRV